MPAFFDRRLAELRHATRQLWKAPCFTAVALVTLALGIGVNTAIFTLTEAVLLKPLPVRQPPSQTRAYPSARGRQDAGSASKR